MAMTKRNRLAFARVLAGERDGVGVASLAALSLGTQATTGPSCAHVVTVAVATLAPLALFHCIS
jgi:hypothetical protein